MNSNDSVVSRITEIIGQCKHHKHLHMYNYKRIQRFLLHTMAAFFTIFMPLSGGHAFIGEIDKLEKIPEYKVEIVCTEEQIHAAVAALKLAHPYETPSYQVLRMEKI